MKFIFNNKLAFLSSYYLGKDIKRLVYHPYIKKIISIEKKYSLYFRANQSKTDSSFLNKLIFYIKLSMKFIIYYKNFKNI